jgi:hypothetical protein
MWNNQAHLLDPDAVARYRQAEDDGRTWQYQHASTHLER